MYIEYKLWWVVDLFCIVAFFNSTVKDLVAKQTLEALKQIYGYIIFNDSKFEILMSWIHVLFLYQNETKNWECLKIYIVKLETLYQ